ncbi:MAG: hypothetical protein ABI863_22365 [Ginsengibacter sp.]
MKAIFAFMFIIFISVSCNTNSKESAAGTNNNSNTKDALAYLHKALYSSDLSMPSHPEYAQKVLTVWKMYEKKQ